MSALLETRGSVDDSKFDKLESDWKEAVAGSSTEQIRTKIAEIASFDELNQQQLKADPEVNQLKDSLANLLEPYKTNSKMAKLRIKYCIKMLQDRGAV